LARIFQIPAKTMLFKPVASLRPPERRRHARVNLALSGRYMLENRQEYLCRTIDLSCGGLALAAPIHGEIGEKVIAYFETLGRVEGKIVRRFDLGFAMTAIIAPARREKLADRLTWLINRETLGLPEDRRHERIVPKEIRTTIRFDENSVESATIIDISASGVAINCARTALPGSAIQIGRRRARVVRILDHGMALEFALPLSFDQFDENVIL
jgi:hypothetical protein